MRQLLQMVNTCLSVAIILFLALIYYRITSTCKLLMPLNFAEIFQLLTFTAAMYYINSSISLFSSVN